MSIPSWFRPPRGPNGDVTVPCTGLEIVEEPHACPPGTGAGVEVVVSRRRGPADGGSRRGRAGARSSGPALHLTLSGQVLARLLNGLLHALLRLGRDVRAADRGTARGVRLEQGAPRGEADDAVHLEAGGLLVAAHRGVGLRTEYAVGGHVELPLHLEDESALAADLQREAALANLDRPVRGRLGGDLSRSRCPRPVRPRTALPVPRPSRWPGPPTCASCGCSHAVPSAGERVAAVTARSSGSTAQARPDPGGRASSMSPSVMAYGVS